MDSSCSTLFSQDRGIIRPFPVPSPQANAGMEAEQKFHCLIQLAEATTNPEAASKHFSKDTT